MNPTLIHPHSRLRRRAAFSLIEVVLALGISAMGITSVLGLLPQALDQLKKATDVTAEARIQQQVITAIGQADWQDSSGADALGYNFNGRRYYFDNLAQEITARQMADSSARENLCYVADVKIDSSGVALPGGTKDPGLRRITIRVKNSRIADFDFDRQGSGSFRQYSTLVTRTGR